MNASPGEFTEPVGHGVAATLRGELAGGLRLPDPGSGATRERLRELRRFAAMNASLGRLIEAHADAVSILSEAGRHVDGHDALAVWASGGPGGLNLQPTSGGAELVGRKAFCGGASMVDAALVTVDSPEGQRLVFVRLDAPGITVDDTTWQSEGFADAGICDVYFDHVAVDGAALTGPPGWYTARPGFWQGAIGVAALWAGMADAMVQRLPQWSRHTDQVAAVGNGTIAADLWGIDASLDAAADWIDSHHLDDCAAVALACRHCVQSHVRSIMSIVHHETGPAPLAFDRHMAVGRLELELAIGQCHGARDLAVLGALARNQDSSAR